MASSIFMEIWLNFSRIRLPPFTGVKSSRCMTEGTEHFFRVTTDGSDITKSPEDMFEAQNGRIENDLKAVDEMIRKYYEEDGELNGKV